MAHTPAAGTPAKPSAATPAKLYKYYRINKITGHLAELMEIEVDETQYSPRVIGKQDLPAIVQDRALVLLYPNADAIDLERRRAAAKANKDAAEAEKASAIARVEAEKRLALALAEDRARAAKQQEKREGGR